MTSVMIPVKPELRERVEEAIKDALGTDYICLRVVFKETVSERHNYWERRYVTAWQSETRPRGRDCGTHVVGLDSDGQSIVLWGHYDLDVNAAVRDCMERL